MKTISFLDLFTKANTNADLYVCAAHKDWKDRIFIYSHQYSFHHKTSPLLIGQIRPIRECPYHLMELKSTSTPVYLDLKSFIVNQNKQIARMPKAYEQLQNGAVIGTCNDLFLYGRNNYICILDKLVNAMKYDSFINYNPSDPAWILYDSLDEAMDLLIKDCDRSEKNVKRKARK
jgi:hypothetical protein